MSENIRRVLTRYAGQLAAAGLVTGPGGNISARDGRLVYLSPSGFSLLEVEDPDWIPLSLDNGAPAVPLPPGRRPTCEASMHLGCYLADSGTGAVIHTHPVTATALASAGVKFRAPFPDFVALLGLEVPVVDFTMPGGEEIRLAVTGLVEQGHNAVLLKNHGAVTLGASVREAFFRALVIEEAARFMLSALAAGKQVPCLTRAQAEEIGRLPCENYRKSLFRENS